MYVNHVDALQWIEDTDVLEMIVDKFSSSVSTVSCLKCLQEDLDIVNNVHSKTCYWIWVDEKQFV